MSKRHRRQRKVWGRKNGHGYVKRLSGPPVEFSPPGVSLTMSHGAPSIVALIGAALRRSQSR